jgi:DNA end-binding protein Ku
MLDLALPIVETKRGDFEPEKFEDQYEDALRELIEKKAKREKIERPKQPARSNAVNLMEPCARALRPKAAAAKPAHRMSVALHGRHRVPAPDLQVFVTLSLDLRTST